MIDIFAILLSTALVVYVVLRAYVSNKTETWFTATPTIDEKPRPPRPSSVYRRP
jgi:hypothetical protein